MNDKGQQKIAIITGFYQSPRFLIILFDFLNKQSFKNFDVYVYNCSVEYIECIEKNTYSFEYRILKMDENLGFAGGNNYAIQMAKKNNDYDFYVLINDDTKPDVNWLANLIKIAVTDASIGAVTSKMLYYEPFILVNGKILQQDKATGEKKASLRFYENTGFEDCYYNKKFYLKGFQQQEEDEIYSFRWVEEEFSLAIPVSLKKASGEYKLKIFIRKNPLTKKRLLLSIGKTAIGTINLRDNQVCYTISISSSVIQSSYTHIIQNAGSDYDRRFNGYDKGSGKFDEGQYNKIQEVNMFCGGACLLTKKALQETGLFNSHFFSYYEDSDLSLRLKRKGFKIIYNPDAFVFHYHSGSGKEWSPFFTYYVFRNKIIFSAKNFGLRGFLLAFKERLKETLLLLKWAGKSRFKDHRVKARLKLNYHILIDSVVGIVKYKASKF
jgi:O-antigen biosynthesis protein